MILRMVAEMSSKKPQAFTKQERDTLSMVENIVSSCECTGAQPTPPKSESEKQSYLDVANVPDEVMRPQMGWQHKCSRGLK